MSATLNGIALFVCMAAVGWILLLGCRAVRQQKLSDLPVPEILSNGAMLLFGFLIVFHIGVHGNLFSCPFPGCTATATPWLVGYAFTFALQPIFGWWYQKPYEQRDVLGWLITGAGCFILFAASGKAFFEFVYIWGRELILQK
ncbi:MAG: hypothetical protein ACR2IE_11315 [Candidatus Sumerlaeaceae bacterium]